MRGIKGVISLAVIILTVSVFLVFTTLATAVPSYSCTDSDGTNINNKGYVSGYEEGFSYTYYDSCSGSNVIEYVCSGSYWSNMALACSAGYACQDGKCVAQQNACPAGADGTQNYGCQYYQPTNGYTDYSYACSGGASCQFCSAGYVKSGNSCVQACTPQCPVASSVACGSAITPANDCGSCTGTGTYCSSGTVCSSSSCICPPGAEWYNGVCTNVIGTNICTSKYGSGYLVCSTPCDPATLPEGVGCATAGYHCVDTKTANTDCGGCGNACAAGTTCQDGVCTSNVIPKVISCADGLVTKTCVCSGQTVSTGYCCSNYYYSTTPNDQNACGACGNVCGAGANAGKPTCVNGVCIPEGDTLCSSLSQSACSNYLCCYNDYTNPTGTNPTWLGCKPSSSTTVCSTSKTGNDFGCSATITSKYCDGSHAVCGSRTTTSTEYAATGKLWYYSNWQTATTSLYCTSDPSSIACSGNQPQKGVYGCVNLYGTAYCYDGSSYYNNRVGYINFGPPCSGATPYCLNGKCVQCTQNSDCPTDKTCQSGVCKIPDSCTDSDNGEDIWTRGSVTGYKDGNSYGPSGFFDSCNSDVIPKVIEEYCEGAQAKTKTISCPVGYGCENGYCKELYPKCSNLPVTVSPQWQTNPIVDYSTCCLNEPATTGADYAAWKVITPTTKIAGYTVTACRQDITCGATGSSTKGTDGLCPESIASGFTCSVCDADCFGTASCNQLTKNGAACKPDCTPIGPSVDIKLYLPSNELFDSSSCTNQNLVAKVTCTQAPGGFACDGNSYAVKFSTSKPNSGVCDQDYDRYSSSTSYTATEHGWLCAAAKNVAGVAGFSALYEVKIDKTPPVVSAGTCDPAAPKTADPVSITAPVSDVWCGVKEIKLFDNGAKITKQLPAPFPYGTHTITATATDNAGNPADGFVCSFTVNDKPVVQPPTKLSGVCKPGQTITIGCAATDINQQASTLSTKLWLGTCTAGNCPNTYTWDYKTGEQMSWNSALQTFTTSYKIPSDIQPGKDIAAECQATDEKGLLSTAANAFPLCTVTYPIPRFSNIVISPNPAIDIGNVYISFTSSEDLIEDPVVTVQKIGGTVMELATFNSNSGNDYVYKYTVQKSNSDGLYEVKIKGKTCSSVLCLGENPSNLEVVLSPPTVSSPPDITYDFGTTGHSIVWIPNSNGGTPDKYTIKKDNAIVVGPASWTSGVPITYSV
ncbi:hypothetical protein HYZ41_01745, partial [archaeon]|nr:hypothetical protein [archaeon]